MDEQDWLAQRFEEHRPRLRQVAYRMLGSLSDAEDAVQESWLRLSRSGTAGVENLGGWLTTVVARVCLNTLRSRQARREDSLDTGAYPSGEQALDLEHEAQLADSVGLALLVVLEKLTPAERLAFVLHDMFDLPFEEIAPIVGRTPAAARQLASRARRRVKGAGPVADPDLARQREVVEAFLAAARAGDFEALMGVLDPDIVLRADASAAPQRVATVIRGAATVARNAMGYARLARFSQAALVNDTAGLVFAPRGRLSRVLTFEIRGGRIVALDIIGDPEHLRGLDLAVFDEARAPWGGSR
jgi:RNA polymerase sigma-70 factor (ECF subfamily)